MMLPIEKFELYKLLFNDSFIGNLAITIDIGYVMQAMLGFGGCLSGVASLFNIIIVSVFGYICAITINYWIGKFLLKICILSKNKKIIERHNNLSVALIRYNELFLLLSVIPVFGRFVSLIAGFSEFKFTKIILVCGLCDLCYYVILVYATCRRFL